MSKVIASVPCTTGSAGKTPPTTVAPPNSTELRDQWTKAWGISQTATSTRSLPGGTTESSYCPRQLPGQSADAISIRRPVVRVGAIDTHKRRPPPAHGFV